VILANMKIPVMMEWKDLGRVCDAKRMRKASLKLSEKSREHLASLNVFK